MKISKSIEEHFEELIQSKIWHTLVDMTRENARQTERKFKSGKLSKGRMYELLDRSAYSAGLKILIEQRPVK